MPNDRERFKELLGEDVEFFNKDANQPELFLLRKEVLDHADDCDCDKCAEINLLTKLGLG